jgi:hypothetical protein
MIQIIVARYNENIEWTMQFPNVVICNKGAKIDWIFNQIFMENVGREGHTYYKYIYDNYENLPEHVIFLQGNPFDHSPNIIKNLQNYLSSDDLNVDFDFLSEHIIGCKLSGCGHHPGLPLYEVYKNLFDIDADINSIFNFGAGAQFIVSRNRILKRPREFYLKIVQLLKYSINPIEGFVIERFHGLVFNENTDTPIPLSPDTEEKEINHPKHPRNVYKKIKLNTNPTINTKRQNFSVLDILNFNPY